MTLIEIIIFYCNLTGKRNPKAPALMTIEFIENSIVPEI